MGKVIHEFDKETISRAFIYRQGLSIRAIAVYNALIDLPVDENISIAKLTELLSPATKYCIESAIKELEEKSMLERRKNRKSGAFNGMDYHVYVLTEK